MSSGLFPGLLGQGFQGLPVPVRNAHRGTDVALRGTATVERGTSMIAGFLCAITSVPRSMKAAPVVVRIAVDADGETWTRQYGSARPMRSRLCARGGLLVERLGPATMKFALTGDSGRIKWRLTGISLLGLPLPVKWFRVAATIEARDGRYAFTVEAAASGIGRIVRYDGELDVVEP